MMPRLSIIVPVYNVEKYLRRCINSILRQTFSDFELILVDDGSPDNSGVICDEFEKQDNRILVIHKENGGLSSARNAGLEIASGDYIGFVDSDDWITPDMYEYLFSLIDKYKSDIASVSYTFSNGKNHFSQSKIYEKVFNKREALEYYLTVGMTDRIADYPVWIKLFKRELFNNVRFPVGQLYEDVATNFLLIQSANKYVKSNKICYYYFQEGSSITRTGFKQKDYDMIKIGEQLIDLAKNEGDKKILDLARMKKARAYFSMLSKIALYGFDESCLNKKETIEFLVKKLRQNYMFLLKSPLSVSRKFIMSALVLNINLVRIPIRVVQNVKGIAQFIRGEKV